MLEKDFSTSSAKLRCALRNKMVTASPEECVRQRLITYFRDEMGYPIGLMAIETLVPYNSMPKRADLVVHSRCGKPWMLVECKRPDERIDERTLAQIAMYNKSLDAHYLTLSNGADTYVLEFNREENKWTQLSGLPAYPEL